MRWFSFAPRRKRDSDMAKRQAHTYLLVHALEAPRCISVKQGKLGQGKASLGKAS